MKNVNDLFDFFVVMDGEIIAAFKCRTDARIYWEVAKNTFSSADDVHFENIKGEIVPFSMFAAP